MTTPPLNAKGYFLWETRQHLPVQQHLLGASFSPNAGTGWQLQSPLVNREKCVALGLEERRLFSRLYSLLWWLFPKGTRAFFGRSTGFLLIIGVFRHKIASSL
jgi:hypothetical protein